MAPGQPPDHASPDPLFGPKDARERPEPQPGLTEGRVLGDFRLVRLIGGGGGGDVWEAKQLSLGGRRIALKFIRPDKVGDRAMELFAREARAGARLNHPGIVGVYGFGETGGYAWIAMEFVEGAWTLRDFLADMAREAELPPDYDLKVAEFVALAADAIHVAHQAGVIHRDLKPQNILIGPDHRPRIADFGLARIVDETEMSRTGEFAGTYHYMSPEQVTARRMGIDLRTDVFSLGVVLYEMLTLRRPFNGDTTHQVAAQIVTKDPPDPRTIRSKVPRDLAVIVGKALEKDPDRRFHTMAEFAADLRRVLAHEPIHAQPPTRIERVAKWVRRNPTKSVAAAIGIVAAVVVGGLLVELQSTNTTLTAANTSLLERDRESKILGMLSELAYFETLDDDMYTYARQQSRPAAEWWLEGARQLVYGQKEDWMTLLEWRPGLRDVEEALAELRKKARDRTPAEVEADRAVSSNAADADERRTWHFDDSRDQYKHGELVKLVQGLRWLAKKLETSERSVNDPVSRKAWDEAIAAIMASEKYRDTRWPSGRVTPQLGLVPIGPDPLSGLWEFADLQTGDAPVRGPDDMIVLTPEIGLVFVLLPSGRIPHESTSRVYVSGNAPDRDLVLDPFFISKYEMTFAQWGRTLETMQPSLPSEDPMSPVSTISWNDCTAALNRASVWVNLPTEMQWEYACRAGSSTAWWTGSEPESLRGAANIGLDGAVAIQRVGMLRPNSFGLYDVCGNVSEWCRDTPYSDRAASVVHPATRRGDGLHIEADLGSRALRGGCFASSADTARSANPTYSATATRLIGFGVRPARPITP